MMSIFNTASVTGRRPTRAQPNSLADARSYGRRPAHATAIGGVLGAIVGLAGGSVWFMSAPAIGMPLLLVMGAFFGAFNGVLLGSMVSARHA